MEHMRNLRKHWARWLAGTALLALAAALALYWWLLADLPPVSAAATRLTRPTTQILDRQGLVLYEVLDPDAGKQINLSADALPLACVQATLATEDSRFFLHPGIDPIAIARAAWQNMRSGGQVVSGGSTLTQQLARNLLMDPQERYEQSLRRKLREAWLAWRLEQRYSKDELLALYLNQTYYGNFAFGLEAAAEIFFAKPAAQLSRAECALLAGLVQYPSGYNPLLDPQAAKERQLTVLRLMREAGYISGAAEEQIAAEPLRYRSQLFKIAAPHFVMYVQDLLVDRLGAERVRAGGLRVATTLDLSLQQQAEEIVRRRLDMLNCRTPGVCDDLTPRNRRIDNAAAVVLDSRTGEILAMVGSPNYFDAAIQGNVNAALALRQPGSAIKPFTYAAALDPSWSEQAGVQPLTPASIIPDLPSTFYVEDEMGGRLPYSPVNYDRLFHGPVSVRTALSNSYNIPAVKTLERIGVGALQQIAAQAGISTFTGKYGLALTLGGGEVKLLDLTAAFGIFQDGRRLETRALLDIRAAGAANDASPAPAARSMRVIAPETAYLITDILSDPIARVPAFGEHPVLETPFPAAVKTGTTTDWRDNWTVGYSTERIVGVWVGNADNAPMLDVSGVDGAGPIWRDLMVAAHPIAPAPFTRPEGVVEATVCAPSGLLPTPECPRVRSERFIVGTQPVRPDTQFRAVAIDAATGLQATTETPASRVQQRVYWLLGPEYHDWMVAQGIPILPPVAEAARQSGEAEHAGRPAQDSPLVLVEPVSNTAYQLHPGLPPTSQRLRVSGYTGSGAPWAELRLVADGVALASAQEAARLDVWWALEAGDHHFWLEGRRTPDGPVERTEAAFVQVEPFAAQQQASLNLP